MELLTPDEPATAANAAQIDYWNTTAGQTWARLHDQLDLQIEPLGLEAIRALAPAVGERILDVGCGCGQTTLALAGRVGPTGAVTGVDVSTPMLEVARARTVPVGARRPDFLQIDAQTGNLGDAVFDAAFSRFGVMFFSDPVVAFTNLRMALRPEGRLAFVCWRAFQENPWMRAPMEAALPLLPSLAPSDPAAPGPFAFADPDRLSLILAGAGFRHFTIDPFDIAIGGSTVEQTVDLAFHIGPLGATLREHPESVRAVADAVTQAVAEYDTPNGVLMPAAVWIVQARVG